MGKTIKAFIIQTPRFVLFPLYAPFSGLKKAITGLFKRKKSNVQHLQTKTNRLTPEKKAELEKLFDRLFERKENINSGQFQFIGLSLIRKKMGKRWYGLCEVVYDTAENVINEHIGTNEIAVRYRDHTYVIIFSETPLEEREAKTEIIAKEIQRRLFELDHEDLRQIEIREAIAQIKTDYHARNHDSDFLDALFDDLPAYDEDIEDQEMTTLEFIEKKQYAEPTVLHVETEAVKNTHEPFLRGVNLPKEMSYTYIPFWDVPRKALTTYLCLACPNQVDTVETTLADIYSEFYTKLIPQQQITLDIRTLEKVTEELIHMEKDGRKLLVACPVHYETVYDYDSYELYKKTMEKIPENVRQYLVFFVLNLHDSLQPKNTFWFATPIKAYCRHVFAEMPLSQDVNFGSIRSSGIDGIGVRIDPNKQQPEGDIINEINRFATKAKAHNIPMTFVLGIPSLSITTSTVCAGVNFLAGPAIHGNVSKPDTIHRYRHEDLINELVQ